jgi:hypothetical protein
VRFGSDKLIVAFGVKAKEIEFPNGHVDYSKVHDES